MSLYESLGAASLRRQLQLAIVYSDTPDITAPYRKVFYRYLAYLIWQHLGYRNTATLHLTPTPAMTTYRERHASKVSLKTVQEKRHKHLHRISWSSRPVHDHAFHESVLLNRGVELYHRTGKAHSHGLRVSHGKAEAARFACVHGVWMSNLEPVLIISESSNLSLVDDSTLLPNVTSAVHRAPQEANSRVIITVGGSISSYFK